MWDIGEDPIDVAIGFSHFEVGRAQARHLAARGVKHSAYFGARVQDDTRAAKRRDGFMHEMRARGLPHEVFLDPRPASTASGVKMLATTRAQGFEIDAIACSNDTLALGVMFEAQRRGLRVPEDIAIIGFGDMEFSANCTTPLTTVKPPSDDIAQNAVDVILNPEPDRARSDRVLDLKFQVIPRRSA